MFDQTSPARSIFELLDYLSRDGTEGFLFRGETRAFDLMTPSAFRPFVTSGSPDGTKILLKDRPRPDQTTMTRSAVRASAHERLVLQFGRAIGNVVAQQYGLSSDIIDVTGDLNVAAFFATRRYPRYDPVAAEGLGVVYRFKHRAGPHSRDEPHITLDLADIMGALIGAHDRGVNSFFWFNNDKLTDYGDTYLNQPVDLPRPGYRTMTLHSQGFGLSWSNIADLWTSAQRTYSALRRFDIRDTRLRCQAAGHMRPVYFVTSLVPENIEVSFNTLIRTYYSTQWARAVAVTAIDNMATNAHVERFFFRHSAGPAIDLTPDALWPDADDDPLYKFLVADIETNHAAYLNQHNARADDPVAGLLDRGFLA